MKIFNWDEVNPVVRPIQSINDVEEIKRLQMQPLNVRMEEINRQIENSIEFSEDTELRSYANQYFVVDGTWVMRGKYGRDRDFFITCNPEDDSAALQTAQQLASDWHF